MLLSNFKKSNNFAPFFVVILICLPLAVSVIIFAKYLYFTSDSYFLTCFSKWILQKFDLVSEEFTMEINPLSIILVKSDSKGDRMLFRYPHATTNQRDSRQCTRRKNPYSLIIAEDTLQVLDLQICYLKNIRLLLILQRLQIIHLIDKIFICWQSIPIHTSHITNGNLTGLSDEVLSTLFAVKPELCELKFELKVNNVRFVGHPTLLPSRGLKEINSSMLFNVVFALQAQASQSVVKCYYDLSKR